MFGPIGMPEMVAIFLIALLLFGPKKLPELGRTLGKAITEFRRASNELKATFESHLSELDKENESLKDAINSYTNTDYSSSSNSSGYSYDQEYSYNNYDGSDPSQSSGSSETSASQPTTASATATQDAPAIRDEKESAPHIEGTVPRSKNFEAEMTHVSKEETHPA
ncbi:MAG TPA: TatA/E family twin arginine-targeting protein translocase [Bryobacteraceae bacterium]|nr:TatA/E family twin arginine-targeting protein translocase [Bryobacteraceae bacterium]